MMQGLLVICFLATFIATGASLTCEVCEGFGDTCMGPLQTCLPGFDTCGIIQGETTVGPHMKTIMKSCFPVSRCDEGLTVLNLGKAGTMARRLTCCVGNGCAKVPPPLPPINTSLNGKKCPTCYSMQSFTCKEEINHCAGDEHYCFELAGTTDIAGMTITSVIKGCSNMASCNDTLQRSGSFAGMTVVVTANCTLASGTASSIPGLLSLFFQAFSGILLWKILS
ncbi:phospholipase A2 inhibitor gamma subunit B-like [Heteronotia binoei]|uniref:phospholipase A2 inhibitor gamma subunit B-like n=1 Tax=Heteronotia binoei TaxID=13085 RepID=UPI00292F8C5D|nr:phospholipase A2 inhibitor gamma subunit B-like [Heteronotia binoei]